MKGILDLDPVNENSINMRNCVCIRDFESMADVIGSALILLNLHKIRFEYD